jgi:hypothetical protein
MENFRQSAGGLFAGEKTAAGSTHLVNGERFQADADSRASAYWL